jgi:DNA-binding CsgD family transcriptional regulator
LVADLLIPNALYRVGGSVLIRSEEAFASLGLHRPKHAPEFDDIEPLYQEIQPHLQRALTINQKLGRVAALKDPEVLGSDRRGRVALFVSDPDRTTTPPTEWLRHLHGFTEAESRLVLSLVNGASLTETADRLGITRNTARTHLQRALLKTDTNRQGELIRLVLSGPAGLVNGSKRP